jgi:hypothetical protein
MNYMHRPAMMRASVHRGVSGRARSAGTCDPNAPDEDYAKAAPGFAMLDAT